MPLPAGAECFSPELYLCTNYDSRNLTMLPEHPPRLLGVLDLCAVTINRISLSCGLPGQTNYLVPIGCQHITGGHVFLLLASCCLPLRIGVGKLCLSSLQSMFCVIDSVWPHCTPSEGHELDQLRRVRYTSAIEVWKVGR